MAEFTPITTQEDFDTAVSAAVEAAKESVRNEYSDYLSPDAEKEKYKGYLKPEEAAEKDKKIRGYESQSLKMKIAHETGLPYELAGRLSGETEEDMRKDAQSLAKLIGGGKKVPPLRDPETNKKDAETAALRKLTENLTGKGE